MAYLPVIVDAACPVGRQIFGANARSERRSLRLTRSKDRIGIYARVICTYQLAISRALSAPQTPTKTQKLTRRNPVPPARARVAKARDDRLAVLFPQVAYGAPDRVRIDDGAAAAVDAEDHGADRVVFAGFLQAANDRGSAEAAGGDVRLGAGVQRD